MQTHVAAIQMQCDAFSLDGNLQRAGEHIHEAARAGAKIVLLPELFGTGYSFEKRLFDYMEPIGGNTTQWMKAWSQRENIYLGACICESAYQGNYDTFVMTSPSGSVFTYRKRYPAFFEKLFFKAGSDEGIIHTEFGRIGVMVCWDIVHSRLFRELQNRIDMLLICSAWPDLTTGNIPLPIFDRWMYSCPTQIPRILARKLGVPVMFANMAGEFQTKIPGLGLRYRSSFAGHTCVVNHNGRAILAKKNQEKIIMAQINVKGCDRQKALALQWQNHLAETRSNSEIGLRKAA